MSHRVAIVEDDRDYRSGISMLFGNTPGFASAGSFANAEDALREARRASGQADAGWDLVFMDIDLGPGMNGIEATRALKEVQPDVAVIVLSVFERPATILEAICAGADGYLLKKSSARTIIEQANVVLSGGAPMTPGIARGFLELVRKLGGETGSATAAPSRLGLTDRERDVLRGLVDGLSYREVATSLDIQLDTVRSYIRSLYRKLQVKTAAQAVSRALREGLL